MSHLTPKTVARAIGVSESSVKRWCDQGLIATTKTAGGHRRLLLWSVLEFLRVRQFDLVRPELLGLPTTTSGSGERSLRRAQPRFLEALEAGDEERCQQILLDLHLAGHRVSVICDEVVAKAFREIGDRWSCGTVDVFQERRACEVCVRALLTLRGTLPRPGESSPRAVGCTPECDPYLLPTLAIEIVLQQCGWRATSLGSRIPFQSLTRAVDQYQPRLVWLSVSHIDDEERFVTEYNQCYESLPPGPALIVGGRAWSEPIRRRVKYSAFGDNFQHLEAFAQTVGGVELPRPGPAESVPPDAGELALPQARHGP